MEQSSIGRSEPALRLSVETAGQSAAGALVQMAGIKDGRKFRDAVLEQRDLVVGSQEDRRPSEVATESLPASGEVVELLKRISSTLERIEKKPRQ